MAHVKAKLAILALHPVQYHTPLYRCVNESDAIDAKVLYLDRGGLDGVYEPEFRTVIKWDVPLLEGHDYEFVRNLARNSQGGFFSRVNPGLASVLKRGAFDAIMIQGYSLATCWIALFSARRLGIKVIWRGEVTLRDGEDSGGLRNRFRGALIRAFLKRCDALMYTCAGNKRFLMRYAPQAKILYPCVCAVDNDYFRREHLKYLPEIRDIRAELGIPQGNVVILFCGRLTARKRPLDVALAVRKAGGAGITVVVVGDGPLREEMLAIFAEYGIHVVHVGFVNQSQISRYYTIADIFCLPSENDNSPKALNEAMNFDLVPIVSDKIGTCDDLILDGETGFRFALGDTDEIAACITKLQTDSELRRRMAERAREHVAKFTYRANVAGIESAVHDVLANGDCKRRTADAV